MDSFTQKQIEEINVVKRYLQNEGLNFKEKDIKSNPVEDNPVDVFWEDKKIQVVFADGKLEGPRRTIDKRGGIFELICLGKKEDGRKKFWRDYVEYWKDIIIKPLGKHIFGKSAKGIICLLFCVSNPLFIDEECFKNNFRNFILGANLGQYFFDEIILVCPNKNCKIFPLEN